MQVTRQTLMDYIFEYGYGKAQQLLKLTDKEYTKILNGFIPERYNEDAHKNTAIHNAKSNPEAMLLLDKHYKPLSQLITDEESAELFNDTVLSISYRYNPDQNFIDLFKYLYKQHRYAKTCNNSVKRYLIDTLPENESDANTE
ncbi:hypothetical protein [Bacteroides neonati]|uniref:hypothetical protein n=1 Tax=Bacteroides neonati TaxID=1347393 RepID=UPI0005A60E6F|nr:hypothetical protein [Bacteroides neonati]